MDGSEIQIESSNDMLRGVLGSRLAGIRRIFFVRKGIVDRTNGALELRFESARSLLLDGGPDGERLVISNDEWSDPFGTADSEEDRCWVDDPGRWGAFDVATEYAPLIGCTLTSIEALRNQWNRLIGLRLLFDSHAFDVINGADQTFVISDPDDITLGRFRAHLAERIALDM